MEDTFKWTDDLVKEFTKGFDIFQMLPSDKDVEKFKKSKQQENKEYTEKPPIGLIPEYIFKEQRLADINEAIKRYEAADKEIPNEWVNEKLKLCSWILERRQKPILFTTSDNVPIYEGDSVYSVAHTFACRFWDKVNRQNWWPYRECLKFFSTEAAAKQYILYNKKELSLNDLLSVWDADEDCCKKPPEYYKDAILFKNFETLVNNSQNGLLT